MIFPFFVSIGIAQTIRRLQASPIRNSDWIEALERSRKSFGLESVNYEYWVYPTPRAEGSFWIRHRHRVMIFLSEGMMKSATESNLGAMFESLNASNFNRYRVENQRETIALMLDAIKGKRNQFRYWGVSFLVYPLERFLKIAKM